MTAPSVQLINIFSSAYDNFVATARTCYSSRGIVDAATVAGPPDAEPSLLEQRRAKKYALAQSLFKAGHHTTLQHAHAQFALDHVSRHFIWSFLHSHPFYNSEQVSQRYVEVKPDNFYVPDTLQGAARETYLQCIERQMADYRELGELLTPVVSEEYYQRFRGRYETRRAANDIKKRAQEAARYALPVATCAYMYHTVSVITLIRYYRMCRQYDVPAEQEQVATAMVRALLAREPEFETILQEPIPLEETPEFAWFHQTGRTEIDRQSAARFTEEFDASLDGATSVLINYGNENETVLASAVREVLGVSLSDLDDDAAIELVLDPAKNPVFGESMNLTTLSKLSRAMYHPHYTFRKVMSHAGDSQDQRHRMTPASRPVLMRHYTGQPDYIVPEPVRISDTVANRYRQGMEQSWEAMEKLLAMGESPETVSYLFPNAVKIRFTESADLLNLHHKMAMRLCYNAQEEIWRASLDEARAVTRVHPRIGKWLLPPCGLRKHAGEKPVCPEGDRYCGIPVWRLDRSQYQRII